LLFGVEGFAAGGFGDFYVLGMADPVGGMEASVVIGGEVEKSGKISSMFMPLGSCL
jgi:hypothetical protein